MRTRTQTLLAAVVDHARQMYLYGRSDRVAGLPADFRFVDDIYYHRAYYSEMRKERTRGR